MQHHTIIYKALKKCVPTTCIFTSHLLWDRIWNKSNTDSERLGRLFVTCTLNLTNDNHVYTSKNFETLNFIRWKPMLSHFTQTSSLTFKYMYINITIVYIAFTHIPKAT